LFKNSTNFIFSIQKVLSVFERFKNSLKIDRA